MNRSGRKGIDHIHASPFKITDIPSCDAETMYLGGRSQQAFCTGEGSFRIQVSPRPGHFRPDKQCFLPVHLHKPFKPVLQCTGLIRIPLLYDQNPSANFTNTQYRDRLPLKTNALDPAKDSRIRPLPFSQLAQNVGIEEKAHQNPISRSSGSRDRSMGKSSSGQTGCLTKYVPIGSFTVSGSLRTLIKIRRCCSSAEIPFEAARSFSSATKRSSRFRTNNCFILLV